VDSDIAILTTNSSKTSLTATISENTHEDWLVLSGSNGTVTNEHSNTAAKTIPADTNGQEANADGINWVKDGKGQITPLGSPLTNSICSSMVSSVYENTIASGGEETGSQKSHVNGTSTNNQSNLGGDVALRNSSVLRRSRSPNNRNFTLYDDKSNSSTFSTSGSIYDTSNSSADKRDKNDRDKSDSSVYDTAFSINDLSSTREESFTTRSLDASVSHDLSVSNELDSLSFSSPLRRNNNSRHSPDKRSAIYSEISDKTESVPEFPHNLSPIKRHGAGQGSNRRALALDDTYQHSESQDLSAEVSIVTDGSSDPECNTDVSKSEQSLLPWELEEATTNKPGRDESLNHDEFVNIDHR